MSRVPSALYATFFLVGMANTMLSPLMPGFQSRWSLDDASAGLLFTSQFALAVGSSAMVGWLAQKFGYFRLIAPGMAFIAVGSAGLLWSSWPAALLWVAWTGLGIGLAIPSGNLGLAALFPGASARPIVLLNLSWCIGAMIAPLVVTLTPQLFLPLLSGVSFVAAAGWMFNAPANSVKPARAAHGSRNSSVGWIVAAILFVYVGTENAIAGWMPTRASRGFGGNVLWSALPSIFWTAMLLGRVLISSLVRRWSVHSLLCVSFAATFAGTLIIIFASGPAWLWLGGAICGLSLAPVFPLTVSEYAEATGGGSASGLIFSASGFGGAVLPPLVGFVSTRSQDIRLGMAVALVTIALMLWLQLRLSRILAER